MTATISAEKIKQLRAKTGVGMGKCKKALEEANGDIEQAITILRKAGIASAVKKGDRETKESFIASIEDDSAIALVEVSAETDFVVKNERFVDFSNKLVKNVLSTQPSSMDDFLQQPYENSGTIDDLRKEVIAVLGENINVRRIFCLNKNSERSYGFYSHMGGKIVTIVELSKSGHDDVAKDVAMHVAAESPEYLSSKDVPKEIVERERDVAREQVKGKPENIIDKIIDGKLRAFYDQMCLVNQGFIKDPALSVEKYVKEKADAEVTRFIRWQSGE